MRRVRDISKEENFRVENCGNGIGMVKRDLVKPEPEGTIVLCAFRITGYSRDCDGSANAWLEQINMETLETTGWEVSGVGLYPDTELVVTPEELQKLSKESDKNE